MGIASEDKECVDRQTDRRRDLLLKGPGLAYGLPKLKISYYF